VVVPVDRVVDLVRVVIAVVDLVVLVVEVFQISVVPDLEVVDIQADLAVVHREVLAVDHPAVLVEFHLEDSVEHLQADSVEHLQVDSEDQDSVEVVIVVAVEQPSFKSTFTFMFLHQSQRKFAHKDQFQLVKHRNITKSSSLKLHHLHLTKPLKFHSCHKTKKRLWCMCSSRNQKNNKTLSSQHKHQHNPANPKFTSSNTKPKRKEAALEVESEAELEVVSEAELEVVSEAESAVELAVDTAVISVVDTALEATLEALEDLVRASTSDHPMEVRDHLLNMAPLENLDHTKPMIFLPSPILNYLLYIIVFYVSSKYKVTVLQ